MKINQQKLGRGVSGEMSSLPSRIPLTMRKIKRQWLVPTCPCPFGWMCFSHLKSIKPTYIIWLHFDGKICHALSIWKVNYPTVTDKVIYSIVWSTCNLSKKTDWLDTDILFSVLKLHNIYQFIFVINVLSCKLWNKFYKVHSSWYQTVFNYVHLTD